MTLPGHSDKTPSFYSHARGSCCPLGRPDRPRVLCGHTQQSPGEWLVLSEGNCQLPVSLDSLPQLFSCVQLGDWDDIITAESETSQAGVTQPAAAPAAPRSHRRDGAGGPRGSIFSSGVKITFPSTTGLEGHWDPTQPGSVRPPTHSSHERNRRVRICMYTRCNQKIW